MRSKLFVIIVSSLVLSCSPEPPSASTSLFCDNELILLGTFEQLPHLAINIQELRDSYNVPLDSLFEKYGYEISYKVDHTINDDQKIVLKMHSLDYDRMLEPPPPFNPLVHWIHVYLTETDTLIVRNQIGTLETTSEKVRERYLELREDLYNLVNIAIIWDEESDASYLNQVVTKIVLGYLSIVNEYSIESFGKGVCELHTSEVSILSEKVPFKLRTDFSADPYYDFWTFEQLDASIK